MQEYLELKRFLLSRTQRFGLFISVYLLLVSSLEDALCCVLGTGASYLYVVLLCRYVDGLSSEADVPMIQADRIQQPWVRRLARLGAGLRQQAKPRLLVPIGLGAAVYLYNTQTGDHLTRTEEGSLVLGFLAFKFAHIAFMYRNLRPRFGAERKRRKAPEFTAVPDSDFDMYGERRVQARGVEEAERVLEQAEAAKQGRGR